LSYEPGTDRIDECADFRRTIKDLPEDERPREKLLAHGAEHVSEGDLLAILLRTGAGKATAIDIANRLLSQYGGLQGLAGRTQAELQQMHGIGSAKAVTLLAAFEIGRRLSSGGPLVKKRLGGVEEVAQYFIPRLRDAKKEVFIVVLLDGQNRVIREITVSEGTLNASIVHPREVFREAVTESAAAMILVHNHPGGDPEPSAEDIALTRQLVEAGRMMDVPVQDHVIVAGQRHISLLEQGLL
jgi:DNA repair protein RadC